MGLLVEEGEQEVDKRGEKYTRLTVFFLLLCDENWGEGELTRLVVQGRICQVPSRENTRDLSWFESTVCSR